MSQNDGIRTKTQEWFRNYGHDLASSYRSSALIEHNPTKGEAREKQILTFFQKLLPKSCVVEPNTVIHDSNDQQTAKFDGAILNRWDWPVLYAEGGVTIAPLESVIIAMETKSALDREEIDDIFTKTRSLRRLILPSAKKPWPKTAIFAYSCTNPNLTFLDYATAVHRNGFHSPNSICILGSAVMGLARMQGNGVIFTDDWQGDSCPAFVRCGEDALLLFFYLVSQWAITNPDVLWDFGRYLKPAFSDVNTFRFDRAFLDSLAASPPRLESAREVFKRHGTAEIEVLYEEARRTVG